MQDQVTPIGPWKFDAEVTECFDDMLARSIPDYAGMRDTCFAIGSRYVKHQTDIVDLGCSHGEAIDPFVKRFGATARYIGTEVAPPMLEAARKRFANLIERGIVEIRDADLRREYPPAAASLTLCSLTLQFTPIEHRQRIVRNIHQHTLPGGALILIEKVIGSTAELDQALVDTHHASKEANGYSREAIDRKRLSLEGVLVPVTAKWNEDILRSSGFQHVECIWRRLNFAGWLAVRE